MSLLRRERHKKMGKANPCGVPYGQLCIKAALPLSQTPKSFYLVKKDNHLLRRLKFAGVVRRWPNCGIQLDDVKAFFPNEAAVFESI